MALPHIPPTYRDEFRAHCVHAWSEIDSPPAPPFSSTSARDPLGIRLTLVKAWSERVRVARGGRSPGSVRGPSSIAEPTWLASQGSDDADRDHAGDAPEQPVGGLALGRREFPEPRGRVRDSGAKTTIRDNELALRGGGVWRRFGEGGMDG
jgi:hypothetical protein